MRGLALLLIMVRESVQVQFFALFLLSFWRREKGKKEQEEEERRGERERERPGFASPTTAVISSSRIN